MNSDPNESAAWRAFGILDAGDSASFDEAIRHNPELRNAWREADSITAAVAVVTTVPVVPRAGQLELLHARLGLNVAKPTNWLGISGWGAAAALTLALVIEHQSSKAVRIASNPAVETRASQPGRANNDLPMVRRGGVEPENNQEVRLEDPPPDGALVTDTDIEDKRIVKVETKRLIQEIEVLRDQLENFQERDRKRFEPVAGMAWPIVMRMTPPGTIADPSNDLLVADETPPITAILGDALTAANLPVANGSPTIRFNPHKPLTEKPSAIPIYDAARDTGTLVVSNLPPITESERFNLWVKTYEGDGPVYVGRLPKSDNIGTEPFDFSLGSTGIVPSAFILTKDAQGDPVTPSESNTVLQGPN